MRKVVTHTLIWIAYFVYVVVTDYIVDGPGTSIAAELLIYLSHNILLFYLLLYAYRRFRTGSAALLTRSVLRFVLAVGVFLACRYIVFNQLLVRMLGIDLSSLTLLQWWTLALLWVSRYAVITLAYHYYTSYSRKLRELRAMADERHQQEQQKLSLENKLLRAQIDPHFLYNALNALYAKALPVSKDLGEALLKIAEIMRYAINPTPTSKSAQLTEELGHLRNIVDIARFRFNNRIHLQLDIEGDFSGVQTVPLAFITLSENVLKHAGLNDPAAPGRISIRWRGDGALVFATWNKKRSSREFPSNGIGLNNTIQRLKDYYGDACSISIEDGVDHFALEVVVAPGPAGVAEPGAQNRGQVRRSFTF